MNHQLLSSKKAVIQHIFTLLFHYGRYFLSVLDNGHTLYFALKSQGSEIMV